MKKLFTVILALVMALTMSSAAFAYNIAGINEVPVVDEVLSYSVVAPDVVYIEDLNENEVIKWIAEQTNIQLVFEEYPDSEFATKVNLLLATDQLPDVFMYAGSVFNPAGLADYGGQGMLLAINDLIEEYGYNIKRIYEEQDLLPSMNMSLDGNIYCLPNINECFHCFYSLRAWINNAWLTDLGLGYPNTLDELVTVLTAFRDADPNNIPMSGDNTGWNSRVYPFLTNSFLFSDLSNLSVSPDGTVVFSPLEPAFKDGVAFIAGMIADGLIEREALTQTGDQLLLKGSVAEGSRIGVFTAATWWAAVPAGLPGAPDTDDLRARDYLPLSPVEGPEGVRISPRTGVGVEVGHTVITTACEDPIPLFKMFDWMYGDFNTIRANIGAEGEQWLTPPEGALGINGKPAWYHTLIVPGDGENFTSLPNLWPSNRTADFRLGEMADFGDPETQWAQEPRLYSVTNEFFAPFGDEGRYPSVNLTAAEAEQLAFWQTQINDYTREQVVRFLAGERSLDDWDAFVNEYNNLNLTEYMELRQLAYTRQYAPEQLAERFPN